MRDRVSLYEAKTHLSELVERAAEGQEIIIAKSGKPKARLVPLAPREARRLRKPGRGLRCISGGMQRRHCMGPATRGAHRLRGPDGGRTRHHGSSSPFSG